MRVKSVSMLVSIFIVYCRLFLFEINNTFLRLRRMVFIPILFRTKTAHLSHRAERRWRKVRTNLAGTNKSSSPNFFHRFANASGFSCSTKTPPAAQSSVLLSSNSTKYLTRATEVCHFNWSAKSVHHLVGLFATFDEWPGHANRGATFDEWPGHANRGSRLTGAQTH